LRAFRPEEFDAVWEARRTFDPPFAAGPGSRERLWRRLERSGRFHRGRLDLAIEVRGRLVGEIDARQPSDMFPAGVFELGITLFDARDRGKGIGSEAVRLLTGYLFDHLRAERVQASTDVDNEAMRRVFDKLGFVAEGVMRSFMPGGSGRRDYVLYAVTRGDWLKRAPAG
jgi:RimJ/RimL family protein N-acetyltransferase